MVEFAGRPDGSASEAARRSRTSGTIAHHSMIDLQRNPDRRIAAEIDGIADHELPDPVADVVAKYDARVGQRDRFLWKWIHVLLPHVRLSSVSPEHERAARNAKTVASMFAVLVDDLGERDRDEATMEEASKIPFEWQTVNRDRPGVDADVLDVAERIWSRFAAMLERSPRREEFQDVLEFDVTQALNAIEYSYLVNENIAMANEAEHWIYECNNMMLFPYADVDLMFSPAFDRDDLSVVRRAVQRAQAMARIGNWITTWERELRERDFTSGVVVAALADGLVDRDELRALEDGARSAEFERIVDAVEASGIERDLLDAWERNHRAARTLVPPSDSVDVGRYLDGTETVLQYHLETRGMK